MPIATDPILKFISTIASRFKAVNKVMIFGSRATGKYSEISDYDVAVYWDGLVSESYGKFVDEICEGKPTLHSIDIVRMDMIGDELKTRIFEEGLTIYEKK